MMSTAWHRTRIAPVFIGLALSLLGLCPTTEAVASVPTNAADQAAITQKNTHGLGVSLGLLGASGFLYRHYLDNVFVQANGLALYIDGGNFMTFMAGIHAGTYLSVWQASSHPRVLPKTIALRLVGGATYSYHKNVDSDPSGIDQPLIAPTPLPESSRRTLPNKPSAKTETTTRASVASVEIGIGFEAGAVMRPGFSLALDILLTIVQVDGVFDSAMPMPRVMMVYNW